MITRSIKAQNIYIFVYLDFLFYTILFNIYDWKPWIFGLFTFLDCQSKVQFHGEFKFSFSEIKFS